MENTAMESADAKTETGEMGVKIGSAELARKLGLPRQLYVYLKSPWRSWRKLYSWLNARWQLRKCTQVGRWTRLNGRIFIQNKGQMILGERLLLSSHYAHSVLATFKGGRLEIGDRTFINYGADIAATRLVKIGADCLIGTHVTILDNGFHEVSDHSREPEAQPVVIGDKAWIGNHAIILPGVSIGEGATIGAGSVVTKDVPPYSVAVGNPARVIKTL